MKFLSICSGIEASSVAWEPLGFKAVGFSEIEKFPCSVLAHHYPEVPNFGSLLDWRSWDAEKFDILVGGTPCQDFSIAGKRQHGERADLTFEFIRMAGKLRPEWVVWENVPGVLSMEKGKTFARIIQAVSEFGYGLAWRILDAQNFGVPQRRRRVFIVGHSSGDPRRAGEILFECQGLPRDTKKGGEEREEITQNFKGCSGGGRQIYPTLQKDVDGPKWGSNQWVNSGHGVICFEPEGLPGGTAKREEIAREFETNSGKTSFALNAGSCNRLDYETETFIFEPRSQDGIPRISKDGKSPTLNTAQGRQRQPCVAKTSFVRRLTPIEALRLQGFPDDYLVKVPGYSDTQAYRAVGNSMAVPVMRWIGERIKQNDTKKM